MFDAARYSSAIRVIVRISRAIVNLRSFCFSKPRQRSVVVPSDAPPTANLDLDLHVEICASIIVDGCSPCQLRVLRPKRKCRSTVCGFQIDQCNAQT
jgi:hypothetical protein